MPIQGTIILEKDFRNKFDNRVHYGVRKTQAFYNKIFDFEINFEQYVSNVIQLRHQNLILK